MTDPADVQLIGLPPKDIIEDLSAALLDKFEKFGSKKPYGERDDFFNRCTEVSNEWKFDKDNCCETPICEWFSRRRKLERKVPIVFKTLEEVLTRGAPKVSDERSCPKHITTRMYLDCWAGSARNTQAPMWGHPPTTFAQLVKDSDLDGSEIDCTD